MRSKKSTSFIIGGILQYKNHIKSNLVSTTGYNYYYKFLFNKKCSTCYLCYLPFDTIVNGKGMEKSKAIARESLLFFVYYFKIKRQKPQYFILSWHQTIFPKSPPFSIVAPSLFNYQVRDGLVLVQSSKDTRMCKAISTTY